MRFARVGDFCPNESCPDYGKLQSDPQRNIKKAGKTKQGRQRYQCKTCKQTFTETKGTIFYRRWTPEEEILETLAFLAEGVRISSLARVKGHKRTRSWTGFGLLLSTLKRSKRSSWPSTTLIRGS